MSDKDWLVYLHINKINHKVYVGITHYVNNPNTRWKNGTGYRNTSIIYKAVLKYGWDNFSHIIFCKTDKETACLLERDLIHYYKSKGTSYNIGLGGEGSESFSEETRNKLKQYTPWIKGKKHSKESIERIREAITGGKPYERSNRLNDNVFAIRNALYDQVKYKVGKWSHCYIIGTFPYQGERERLAKELGAEIILIDTDKEECLKRLYENTEGREVSEWEKYICDWFQKVNPSQVTSS